MHVERVPFLSTTTFYREYLDVRPVIITGMTKNWPASTSFTVTRLREELGDIVVMLQGYGADTDESYLVQTSHKLRRVTLRDFLDAASGSVPAELVKAWSVRISTELFEQVPALLEEFDFDGLFPRGHKRYQHFLWIGPPGYTTGLHTDEVAITLHAQLVGHKTVTFYDPGQVALLYPETRESFRDSMFSAVNVFAPDLVKHPEFAKARPLVAELGPGDLLYIPRSWWHWVRGHDLCIAVSAFSFNV